MKLAKRIAALLKAPRDGEATTACHVPVESEPGMVRTERFDRVALRGRISELLPVNGHRRLV